MMQPVDFDSDMLEQLAADLNGGDVEVMGGLVAPGVGVIIFNTVSGEYMFDLDNAWKLLVGVRESNQMMNQTDELSEAIEECMEVVCKRNNLKMPGSIVH